MPDSDESTPNFKNRFPFDVVMQHMRIHHPGCPKKSCLTIAARVSARNWEVPKLSAAVGIELQKYIRHSLTDYDELLRSKMMTREEARTFIAPHVEEVLRAWKRPALKLRLVHRQGGV
ncbi:MAG: DUF2293 domain-containing protein [Mesorhizobium sp.]|nr:MAG: DUF2293 domain-containing protein [Mesorhizobium sp.]